MSDSANFNYDSKISKQQIEVFESQIKAAEKKGIKINVFDANKDGVISQKELQEASIYLKIEAQQAQAAGTSAQAVTNQEPTLWDKFINFFTGGDDAQQAGTENAATAQSIANEKDPDKQAKMIAQMIDEASSGWGTDDAKFEEAIKSLNKDNYELVEKYLKETGKTYEGKGLADYIEEETSSSQKAELMKKLETVKKEVAEAKAIAEQEKATKTAKTTATAAKPAEEAAPTEETAETPDAKPAEETAPAEEAAETPDAKPSEETAPAEEAAETPDAKPAEEAAPTEEAADTPEPTIVKNPDGTTTETTKYEGGVIKESILDANGFEQKRTITYPDGTVMILEGGDKEHFEKRTTKDENGNIGKVEVYKDGEWLVDNGDGTFARETVAEDGTITQTTTDEKGRVIKEVIKHSDFDVEKTVYPIYDEKGNQIGSKEEFPDGKVITYGEWKDGKGKITTQTPDGNTEEKTIGMEASSGRTVNENGDLVRSFEVDTETGKFREEKVERDSNGMRTGSTVKNNDGTITYDEYQRKVKEVTTEKDGTTVERTFDKDGNVTGKVVKSKDGKLISESGVDAVGRSFNRDYDAAGNLKSEVITSKDSQGNMVKVFTDANGNEIENRYDSNNRIVSRVDRAKQETSYYKYDSSGNLLSKTILTPNGRAKVEYSYDAQGQLDIKGIVDVKGNKVHEFYDNGRITERFVDPVDGNSYRESAYVNGKPTMIEYYDSAGQVVERIVQKQDGTWMRV